MEFCVKAMQQADVDGSHVVALILGPAIRQVGWYGRSSEECYSSQGDHLRLDKITPSSWGGTQQAQ